MHSNFVKNVLVSSCQDMVCRIWSETDAQEPLGFYLATVIDPMSYTGLESIMGSFTLHWLNAKDLRHEVITKTDRLKTSAPDGPWADSLQPTPKPWKPADSDEESDSEEPDQQQSTASGAEDDFVFISDPQVQRSSPSRFANFTGSGDGMNSLSTCHTHTPYKRGHMAGIQKPFLDADDSWPDVLFLVHKDGSLIFWSVSHLDQYPRRDPNVKYISRTDEKIVPPSDAMGITGNVFVYPDGQISNWKRCLPDKQVATTAHRHHLLPRSHTHTHRPHDNARSTAEQRLQTCPRISMLLINNHASLFPAPRFTITSRTATSSRT